MDKFFCIDGSSTVQGAKLARIAWSVDELWRHAYRFLLTTLTSEHHFTIILHIEVERWLHGINDIWSSMVSLLELSIVIHQGRVILIQQGLIQELFLHRTSLFLFLSAEFLQEQEPLLFTSHVIQVRHTSVVKVVSVVHATLEARDEFLILHLLEKVAYLFVGVLQPQFLNQTSRVINIVIIFEYSFSAECHW